ncbi:MXAN_6640 family putative metalloprotease [Geobacter sp. DSM 9736]|uniref:MXAN_6640 family putative metalloprotease n=1 Tax=Geobacter sp. DSM 9736 TaxID=1277350 RepID=UPI000B5004E3|nr:MXAN_6640 family putative metalloprotease [Geobacter sp. DSM 9736]SNB46379.1 hypothetical protein SAMN06269301_1834 [Geobacter sp. DSM 9736]
MACVRSGFFLVLLIMSAVTAYAGALDDYYLSRLVPQQARAMAKGEAAPQAVVERCLTHVYRGLKKDWNKLEPETRRVLGKAFYARPTLQNEQTVPSPSGRFVIHYSAAGPDMPQPVSGTVDAWVATVAAVFDHVYAEEVTRLEYREPPALPFHVFLRQLGSQAFGVTETEGSTNGISFASFMTLDNDFADEAYGAYRGVPALQITAAHEFHHAIQFGYNINADAWYAEATSSWIEDEVYDNVNQVYSYSSAYLRNTNLPLDTDVSTSTGGGYGRWIFNRHLAERFTGTVIRDIWARIGTVTNATDTIPMLPLIDEVLRGRGSSLSDEFFSFTKKLYMQSWTTHRSELDLLYQHPILPEANYQVFPVNGSTSPPPAVALPHFSFAFFFFEPSVAAPASLALTVSRASGIRTSAFRETTGNVITEIQPDANGNFNISPFGGSDTAQAAILFANAGNSDGAGGSFTTDGTTPPVASEGAAPPNQTPAATTGGDGGGGCFIATAAFGSYLHPKVKTLRDFRDQFLMKTEAGRAFVTFYYRMSPPVADFIARNDMLRGCVRALLIPIIAVIEYSRLIMIGLMMMLSLSAVVTAGKAVSRKRHR